MAYLILGSHPVSSGGLIIPTIGHLFLALSNDTVLDNGDFIIRAGPQDSTLFGITYGKLVAEINFSFGNSKDSFRDWGQSVGLDEGQASSFYAASVVDLTFDGFGSLNAFAAWKSLISTAAQIHNYEFSYVFFNQNSNSFIGTLLATLGIQAPGLDSLVTSLGVQYLYPASDQVLSYDSNAFVNSNRSYDIRGAYLVNAAGAEIQFNDRLFALNSNIGVSQQYIEGDHLSGFGGDDELHDGNRKDTLEGGAGNDTFVLMEDGAQDIIIVGEGDDIIRGGDANDRIVLRTSNIQMPEPSEVETVGPGLGDLATTRAIPLLGGFGVQPHLGGFLHTETETAYVYHYQNTDPDVAQEWWRPRFESVTRFRPNEFSSWDEYLIRYENDGLIDYSLPFGFTYTLENGNLKIEGSQFVENESGVRDYVDFTVLIEDFEQGDFGIRFFEFDSAEIITTIEVSRGEFETRVDPELWYFPTDQAGIDYINNNGNYITVPEAIDPTVPTVINNPPRPPRTITGTPDADELRGTIHSDLFRALAGDDTVTAGGGNDRVDAGEGNDTVYAGLGADLVIGGAGLDQLFGGEGDDGLAGGDDADTLNGGQGDDRLFGDAGDDILRGDYGIDVMRGGSGNDTINGQYDNDELFGEDGDDWLGGGFGDDVLHGDLGNDRLVGHEGDDALNGNDGDDLLNGADGIDTLFGGAGIDRLLGGKGNDTLDGGEGDDELHGQDWDDLILGGEGNDLLYGGTGNDTVDGGAGLDQLFGGEGDDGLAGGDDADTLNGGLGDDRLFGDAGDDILRGDYGIDVMHGGSGNDTINGHHDNDELFGEDGDDWLGGGFGDDVLHGDLGNDRLVGHEGDDALNGNDGDDLLNGADGIDTLFGGAGIDRLLGGMGNDTLDGGEGDDELHGQDWDDLILGGEGNDRLYGGTGNDTLDGGAGDDQLFGGVQNDRFMFSLGGGRDVIHDFQNVDVIAFDWDLATSYSNAMAHASQVGDDTVFTFGEDVLTILNTSLSDISFGDVFIV